MTGLIVLLVAIAAAGVGIVLGALLNDAQSTGRARRLAAQEARVHMLWRSLHAANRINATFWYSREAMRREAERQTPGEEHSSS